MGDGPDSSYIRCISLSDGKRVWSSKVGKPGGDHPGTRCTPSVDGQMDYASGQWGDRVAVKAGDGKEVWRKRMKSEFRGKMLRGWGYAESRLGDGDNIVDSAGRNAA